MLTQRQSRQGKLILLTIEELIPKEHFLRKLDAAVDFSFIYDIVRPLYSNLGRPSIDPVILIKMLLIGYLYGIDSERRLEDEIRYNIAYRWFLGLDMDDPTPDHSTISQNRRRRFHGNEVFRQIFEAIVYKCMEAGLVSGENIVMDSTHIKANADNHNSERVQVSENIDKYWLKLMDDYPHEKHNSDHEFQTTVKIKNPYDPDAGYMNRAWKPKGFHYLAHQCSDADTGIIVDVAVTSGDTHDSKCCVERFEYLRRQRFPVKRAAMDKGYDTMPVHHGLSSLGITGYISRCDRGNGRHTKDGLFSIDEFVFDPVTDSYTCPAGSALTFRGLFYKTGIPLRAYCSRTAECKNCAVHGLCYKGKNEYRRISRHIHQQDREAGIARGKSAQYQRLMRRRQIICEGNFALQKRCHNLRFTRKRGQENVLEQCLLSATALNLKRLVWYGAHPLPPAKSIQARINQDGWFRSFLLRLTRIHCKTSALCNK